MSRFVALVLIVATASPLYPQAKNDPLGKALGLTPEKKALPVWTSPSLEARQALAKATADLGGSVIIVGITTDQYTNHGTAWVLSQKNRLLATNAHVADIMLKGGGKMRAVRNNSTAEWTVVQAWYHPGVRRRIAKGVSAREPDPYKGSVDGRCPDLAILEVAQGGPELPPEFPLASPAEIENLFGVPVGMLGFPGTDSKGLPAPGKKPQATYHDGVISRLTDFNFDSDVPEGHKQFVQHTVLDWGGFSGSPIFLANGKVVAIHNWARSEKGPFGDVRVIPHGIRVDCLWELLLHHGLADKVSTKIDAAKLDVERWLMENERDRNLRRAIQLVSQASFEIYTKENFEKGIDLCTEAITLAPNYPSTYIALSDAHTNQWFKRQIRDRAASLALLGKAEQFALLYAEKAGSTDPDVLLALSTVKNNLGYVLKAPEHNRLALALANKVLDIRRLPKGMAARAQSCRAVAYSNLDEEDLARQCHALAVDLDRDNSMLWDNYNDWLRNNRGKTEFIKSNAARSKLLREKRESLPVRWYSYFEKPDRLVQADPGDTQRKGSFRKVIEIELRQGRHYQIDLFSETLDTYLRVEDDKGNILAQDDDSGGDLNSLIFFQPRGTATYRIIATTYHPGHTGNFTVRIQEGR